MKHDQFSTTTKTLNWHIRKGTRTHRIALQIVKLPPWLGTLIIVACSIALSLLGTYVGIDGVLMAPKNLLAGWLLAVAIPLVVSLPVGFFLCTLLSDLERARSEAEQLANIDILTGALNRRRFIEISNQQLRVTRESGISITVLLLDVDDFKQVNDRHGHESGDAVLKMITKQCAKTLRSDDVFARWGGEEFVALLPETDAHKSRNVALRIRDVISSATVATRNANINVTVSIGIAPRLEWDETLDDLITRADQAMYKAKRDGKNAAVMVPLPTSS